MKIYEYVFKITLLLLLSSSISANELQKVSLQLQWKHQFEFAGFYAAKEKGYYEAEGLEVQLREIDSAKDTIEEVLSSRATYATAYSSLVDSYIQGKPVVMLANFFKSSALVLIAQEGIGNPSNLIGKKVMANKSALSNPGFRVMFEKFNMSLDDIEIVEPTYNIDDFVNKNVDAMTAFKTNQPYLLNQKKIKYTIHNPSNYGTQLYDVNLFTSQDEVKKHPKRVQAFRRASIKGWKYALEHSDEIIELILKKYNTQHKTKEALEYEAEITKELILQDIYELGSIDYKVIKKIAKEYTQDEVDFSDFYFIGDCVKNIKNLRFSKKQKEYLQNIQEITMCVDPNWMPYEKIEDNQHKGIAADYMKIVESKIGKPIRMIPTASWSESIEFAKKRKCDIFSLAMETPSRKEYMNFTAPYLEIPLVIATKMDKFFILEMEDLLDREFAIAKDYAYVELLRLKYPSIKLVEVDNVDEGLKRVDNGEFYGFIGSLTAIGYKMQNNYNGTLKIAGRLQEVWSLGIGVRNDRPELLNILNVAILSIDDKTKRKIMNEWTNVSYDKGFDYTLFWWFFSAGGVVFFLLLFRYVTAQKYTKALQKSIDIIDENVLISYSDKDGYITNASEALCKITGYTKEELIGQNHSLFRHPDTPKESFTKLWKTITNGDVFRGEIKNLKKDGSIFWIDATITPMFDSMGNIEGYTAIRQDITDKKYIEQLAVTDRLTQAYNRLHLENIFTTETQKAKRHGDGYSVVIMDIDFFKEVNDNYGHDVGDTVLVEIVKILKSNIREIDVLGRWGGEEFLIICTKTDASQAQVIAEKLRAAIESHNFDKAGKITCSFGVSEYKNSDVNSDNVVKRADDALYSSKNNGRNRVIVNS